MGTRKAHDSSAAFDLKSLDPICARESVRQFRSATPASQLVPIVAILRRLASHNAAISGQYRVEDYKALRRANVALKHFVYPQRSWLTNP
jgi:hypothetical protein